MGPKPENDRAPDRQTPGNQTPADEPGKAEGELSEDDLEQVAGGDLYLHSPRGSCD